MNAAEFLANQGRSIPTHSITVRLIDPLDPSKVAEAPAVLRLVPDRLRLAADDAAAESLSKLKYAPSENRRATEETYYLLMQAVRCADSPGKIFFETIDQAKSMLVEDEALRLRIEYDRYKQTNFPSVLTDEEAQKIAKDAENFSARDLLRSYGYWQILRALPFLAGKFGALPTSTSSPTPSAST